MNRDLVSSALERIDAEPSNEFLGSLRTRLLAEFEGSRRDLRETGGEPHTSTPQPPQEYVMLAPNPLRDTFTPRLVKIVLAAAACITLFVVAALITNRPNSDLPSNGELNDVDLAQATALGQSAFARPEDVVSTFRRIDDPISEATWAQQAEATAAANPACALLPSLGLAPPTTKAALPRQWLHGGVGGPIAQSIRVFATPADASRAMDMIAGAEYQACDRDLFDRLTPFGTPNVTSTTEQWQAPTIAPHGDRQIIIGQHTTFSGAGIQNSGVTDEFRINAYIQVGRAISWINPRYLPGAQQPLFVSDNAITASATALEAVFGT